MNILGIQFAPLSIPLERRLQTAAVFYYCTSFVFFGTAAIGLFIYFLFTKFFFIPLLYFAWFVYDHKKCCQGGRRIDLCRRSKLWRYFADYFPVTMIKTAELDPNKNYIFGYHPHGIMCYGAFSCFGTEARDFSKVFPGITPRLLTLEGQFWFPLHREHIMSAGCCAATRESIDWLLTKEGKGNALVLVIGGAAEALDAHPGDVNLTLKRRRGFVRLALKHGASLVPVFAFGENDIFQQVENPKGSPLRQFQDKLKSFLGFSAPLFRGRGMFQYNYGLLPYRKPITVIIGKPIDVEKISEPTEEDVKTLHQKYIDDLTSLFEEHKKKYAPDLKLMLS
ncbi:2-acylglycerol O-acyltransferase 2-like [Argiope bruennichi]|uniref:Acyltransferase n=1 Tax=Argiope bruennichi TaxID=94029 RepID=A0A8T0FKH4_ARGBR|nr:2-acylglycerol O-acyltransferase 2-like [Argiope bruennichi]XP_055930078.1 2-acylglycerol O-acyltransferase 2-like [Argiope bruennichi]XP_055930079.1 2-acylglycerol O-acyltransferase 2-like [Argiope bruennichi]KAF8791446.1 2-acylglycerol O-acyltransferase 1 like protein [Argiope bruennichi]